MHSHTTSPICSLCSRPTTHSKQTSGTTNARSTGATISVANLTTSRSLIHSRTTNADDECEKWRDYIIHKSDYHKRSAATSPLTGHSHTTSPICSLCSRPTTHSNQTSGTANARITGAHISFTNLTTTRSLIHFKSRFSKYSNSLRLEYINDVYQRLASSIFSKSSTL